MTTGFISAEEMRSAATAVLSQSRTDAGLAAELCAVNEQRWGASEDLRLLRAMAPQLPQLPETAADEIYERVCEQERRASPRLLERGYDLGTAVYEDELAVFGQGPLILDAHHATNPIRRASGEREGADHGTAGLVGVMALDGLGRAIIPLGRQSGNANVDGKHPVKDAVAEAIHTGTYNGFFSVHGMLPGKVVDLRDPTEVHAVIGLGKDPRDSAVVAAERLVHEAHERWGLRVLIGNFVPHLNFAKDSERGNDSYRNLGTALARAEKGENAGQIAIGRLAATGPNNMATYVNRLTANRANFGVAQIELSRSLRLTPADYWRRADPVAEKIGVYLGHSFCVLAAGIIGSIAT